MPIVQTQVVRDLLKVYFIMGSLNCAAKDPKEVLRKAIEGGVTLFQFREKGTGALKGENKLALALELKKICHAYNIPFIVNDDVDLALKVEADGVHIGQDDEDIATVRERIGQRILGVSAHSLEEVETAISLGADYLGMGPVYPTKTKEDANPVAGVSLIQTIREKGMKIPVVGIGGINAENASKVIEAGADGVAVISAISNADAITEAAGQIRKMVEKK